jgi:GAF domain-containing protein
MDEESGEAEAEMADASEREAAPDAAEVRLNRLLNLILESAVEALGFDAATVSARHGADLATIAATDRPMIALDDAQYETGQGPCLAVLDSAEPISLDDAQADDRWEHFSRVAADLGVHSTLSLRLPVDTAELAASLNLYSRTQRRIGDDQISAANRFAQQLAATISTVEAHRSTARLAQHLAEAMRSRATIEQAKGMLMADHRIDEAEAFDRLVALSNDLNMKLRVVAQRLVQERSNEP